MLRKFSRTSLVIIFSLAVLLSGILWWNVGGGVSEKTALNLADDYAQDYAARNNIDLTKYNKPKLGQQPEGELYTFNWLPNDSGKPFTVIVDAMTVEVYFDEFPE